ncbi:MAG TPA: 5-dehydro-4-deoxyglucarate dehydratase [Jatrophihabitantaceae bacterium]|jgi:5-dehydro-4-deoxyglucarate dehydratase|nr:5-dehydro-4-deoxyglucarate dehydratase [Jatrophihabitantaceae bacterium]
MLGGVLFFPVTPFTATGEVDHATLAEHVRRGVAAGPGAVFVACGTGEFHALDVGEYADILATTVAAVGRQIPVFAGAGGSVAQARGFARAAAAAGVDGILLLPAYLVRMPQQGLIDYVATVAGETHLQVIVYHRGNARFTEASAAVVSQLPTVVGLKDGVGDVDLMSRIVLAVRAALEPAGKSFHFFNGMPTAEAFQRAYRAIGVPLYSSATFAFAPDVASAFHAALERGDDVVLDRLLTEFYGPLVRLRDQVPGYAVSLVKAGVRLEGLPVGSVRPPLIDPTPAHIETLAQIIAAGRAALAVHR